MIIVHTSAGGFLKGLRGGVIAATKSVEKSGNMSGSATSGCNVVVLSPFWYSPQKLVCTYLAIECQLLGEWRVLIFKIVAVQSDILPLDRVMFLVNHCVADGLV
jgi:hypothetical protein